MKHWIQIISIINLIVFATSCSKNNDDIDSLLAMNPGGEIELSYNDDNLEFNFIGKDSFTSYGLAFHQFVKNDIEYAEFEFLAGGWIGNYYYYVKINGFIPVEQLEDANNTIQITDVQSEVYIQVSSQQAYGFKPEITFNSELSISNTGQIGDTVQINFKTDFYNHLGNTGHFTCKSNTKYVL